MTPGDYQARLRQWEQAQRRHAMLAPLADAAIALASPGPAPVWEGDVPGAPVGVQVMGQMHTDARMVAIARWLLKSVAPVEV